MSILQLLYNAVGHLRNILIHKWWVMQYGCMMGIPFRAFMHDWSKLSPVEFWESVRYYQRDSSPIIACKKDKGWSAAWFHHRGRNPHHYEYWIDRLDEGGAAVRIPHRYVIEMVCDWLAAGRTYRGKDFTFTDELRWWQREKHHRKIHKDTAAYLDIIFEHLAEEGLNDIEYVVSPERYESLNSDI